MIGGSSPGRSWVFFSLLPRQEWLWDPSSFLSNWYQGLFPLGVKRLGREANHSPPCSVEVNERSYTCTPPKTPSWHCVQFKKKHRDNVTFTLLCPNQPPTQWVPRALTLGLEWLGRETDHSPSPSIKVKNAWSYAFTFPLLLHGVVLKHRDVDLRRYINCWSYLELYESRKGTVVAYFMVLSWQLVEELRKGRKIFSHDNWIPGGVLTEYLQNENQTHYQVLY
jgi:hypothetical protein